MGTRLLVACVAGWSCLSLEAGGQAVTQTRPPAAQDSALADSGFRSAPLRRRALESSLEASQLTLAGGDLGLSGKTRFEGIIAPHLLFVKGRWGLVGTPKIVLRMLTDTSASVRSPSFMPRITGYYILDELTRDDPLLLNVLSLTISHHSNGQSGPFYLDSARTQINYAQGSFSTNYLEFAYQRFTKPMNRPTVRDPGLRLGLRVHVPIIEDSELRDYARGEHQYGRYRLLASGNLSLLFLRLAIGTQYMIDKKVATSAFFARKRLIGNIATTWVPNGLRDVGVFLQYYYGQDYYNILYPQRLSVIRGGIAVTAISNVRS